MLLEELKALAERAKVSGCVVGIWVAGQDSEVQDTLKVLAENPKVNLTEALNLLKKHFPNLPFKRTSFVTHMRGTCACQQA